MEEETTAHVALTVSILVPETAIMLLAPSASGTFLQDQKPMTGNIIRKNKAFLIIT